MGILPGLLLEYYLAVFRQRSLEYNRNFVCISVTVQAVCLVEHNKVLKFNVMTNLHLSFSKLCLVKELLDYIPEKNESSRD